MTPLNGVLPVDKPTGPTSHDIVGAARRALRERRIGHTGTLDPFASGLLLLCIGPATRLAEYLTALPKSYEATVRLGAATTTDDHAGEVIECSEAWRDLSEARIADAFAALRGEILQVPPRYSAKRVGGQRMYEAARRGEEVEIAPTPVTVHRLDVVEIALPEVRIEVDCSSGTYIRAIARDAGARLGIGGHLTALRRTRVGDFDVADAIPADHLDDSARVAAALLPPAAAVRHLPAVPIGAELLAPIRNGRAVDVDSAPADGPIAMLDAEGTLIAIGEWRGGQIQPRKVLI